MDIPLIAGFSASLLFGLWLQLDSFRASSQKSDRQYLIITFSTRGYFYVYCVPHELADIFQELNNRDKIGCRKA